MYKILVVDDENKSRLYLVNIITEIQPDALLTHTNNPLEALQLLKETPYDLLFTDIVMPHMDGISILKELKQSGNLPFTVMVSAYKDFEYAQEALNRGASGYILKPFDKEKVAEMIDRFIQQQPESEQSILFSSYNGLFPVGIDEILAIEKEDRNLIRIYTKDNPIKAVRGVLSEIKKQLPTHYIYINRQCIVNRNVIKRFNPKDKTITLSLDQYEKDFSCSRSCMKEIAYWFNLRK
ncbi:response regulator [Parabacteroides sp. 52]|uniref:LytR/AlgR family response regulator transcription factor n=1 Tax=unclassified Parabacteroides TaxID=2649774 RepID=UPI0013D88505|nr:MULTISPECIES: response regulator [unclassified Parabacteroides]MDH6533450.1 DNA-binding LytR/AlgR family response regulator [Parabacteroides sp. PM5-20]NDV54206.1 response regulator [Parabacteroides sp. 52]